MSYTEEFFGFISKGYDIEVGDYFIRPVENHAELSKSFISDSNRFDNFYYPPEAVVERTTNGGPPEEVPGSRHAPHLFRLRPSHSIRRRDNGTLGDPRKFRKSDGGLLIHALAFLVKARCQFHDLWFDARVPAKPRAICEMTSNELALVLGGLLRTYREYASKTEQPRLAIRFVNLLYVKSRIGSYQWGWERFFFEYSVFDALFRCLKESGIISPPNRLAHGQRFVYLGEEAKIIAWDAQAAERAIRFVDLRNDLAHETLWDGASPSSDVEMEAAAELSRLNDRLILTAAQIPCGFRRSNWLSISYSDLRWEGPR